MAFETQPQQQIYEKVAPWVRELFGAMANPLPDQPLFVLNTGQMYTMIAVNAWGTDDATITSRCYVSMGTEMTSDLMHYLLRENDKFRFGAFGVDKDDDIFFEHTIVGSTCDKEELKASALAVSSTSDRYADEIIPRFGGERQIDKLRHMAS